MRTAVIRSQERTVDGHTAAGVGGEEFRDPGDPRAVAPATPASSPGSSSGASRSWRKARASTSTRATR